MSGAIRRIRLWLARLLLPRGWQATELPPLKQYFGTVSISGQTFLLEADTAAGIAERQRIVREWGSLLYADPITGGA